MNSHIKTIITLLCVIGYLISLFYYFIIGPITLLLMLLVISYVMIHSCFTDDHNSNRPKR